MKEYIKTRISRYKLYDRNYTRDSIVKIKLEESDFPKSNTNYKALINILTQKYLDCERI